MVYQSLEYVNTFTAFVYKVWIRQVILSYNSKKERWASLATFLCFFWILWIKPDQTKWSIRIIITDMKHYLFMS